MKEVKTVIDNVLIHMSNLDKGLRGLDNALSSYIEFNGDKDKWIKWIEKRTKELEREANESKSNKSGDSSGGTGAGKTRDKASKKQDK